MDTDVDSDTSLFSADESEYKPSRSSDKESANTGK